MTDRNKDTAIEADINFIEDILHALESDDLDQAYEYLDDWKDELETLLKQ